MIVLTAEEVAHATSGYLSSTVDPTIRVNHATTDSREVTVDSSSLFIAKPGDRADGHDFVASALDHGAKLVLASRETTDSHGQEAPAVIVKDVVEAMGALAAYIVERIKKHSLTTVIGITGSAGKTTTKDALHSLLQSQGPTVAPINSYNGEVGVPLTIFQASLDTRYLIVEMGADHVGNIADLCSIVKPDIGIVLMVGTAHAGSFGGVENIARTKGELVEAIPASGTVILNNDDPVVSAMKTRAQPGAAISWFTTGAIGEENTRSLASGMEKSFCTMTQNVTTDDQGHPEFDLVFATSDGSVTESQHIISGLFGIHHAANLAAAASAAFALGMTPQDIAQILNGLGAGSKHRMSQTDRADGVRIIDDSYNANPESMRAGLKALAMMGRATQRRTVAVLGEMLELGEQSVQEQISVGETVVRLNINELIVVGTAARPMYTGAMMEGSWGDEATIVDDVEQAQVLLNSRLREGDIVFIKGSNSTGLWRLADALNSQAQQEAHS